MSLYGSIPVGAGYLRQPEPARRCVDFIIRYKGKLPASTNHRAQDKHRVREHLNPQLETLCHRNPLFRDALLPNLGYWKGPAGKFESPGSGGRFFRWPLCGYDFIPLIHRPLELVCQLDITWLRREIAGDIVHGGDLDNRLKTLLDGLRMPHQKDDLKGFPQGTGKPFFCLLEDDSLITKLSVSTYQLLEPLGAPEQEHDVDLILHVTVQSTSSMMADMLGMPS